MTATTTAVIELRDLHLNTDIGTYGPNDTRPDFHILDLTLGIAVDRVLIAEDGMAHVFDYDPLIVEIDRLAADGHYETQERLMTRIAGACATHAEIQHIEICLKKSPVRSGNGSLGVRLKVDAQQARASGVLSPHLLRELRSDHAGETGAVFIYKGIVAVARWRGDDELIAFAEAHGATEADHLRQVEDWLPAHQRSVLLGPWRLAGWLTGAIPALFGRRAVYGTIAAVETFVDHHYQQQIDHIKQFGAPAGLLALLVRCQADEQHHRDEAADLAGTQGSWILRAWCWVVGKGSASAVVLARRF